MIDFSHEWRKLLEGDVLHFVLENHMWLHTNEHPLAQKPSRKYKRAYISIWKPIHRCSPRLSNIFFSVCRTRKFNALWCAHIALLYTYMNTTRVQHVRLFEWKRASSTDNGWRWGQRFYISRQTSRAAIHERTRSTSSIYGDSTHKPPALAVYSYMFAHDLTDYRTRRTRVTRPPANEYGNQFAIFDTTSSLFWGIEVDESVDGRHWMDNENKMQKSQESFGSKKRNFVVLNEWLHNRDGSFVGAYWMGVRCLPPKRSLWQMIIAVWSAVCCSVSEYKHKTDDERISLATASGFVPHTFRLNQA